MVVPQNYSHEVQQVLSQKLYTLDDGLRVYMKHFGSTREYPILDLTNILTRDSQANDPNYHRYGFDWNKMNRILSKEAKAYYKAYETEPTKNFQSGGKFIGFSKSDIIANATSYMATATVEFNRWIDSETEIIEVEGQSNMIHFCKVKILDLQTNQGPSVPIPTSIHITYIPIEKPISKKKEVSKK